jgi:hypothetical protein
VRSRFADVPVSGRVLRPEDVAEAEQAAAAAAEQAAAAEAGADAAAAANAAAPANAAGKPLPAGGPQAVNPALKPQVLQPVVGQELTAELQPVAVPGSDANAPAAGPAAGPREATPLAAAHDLSGLDRQAFKVLPDAKGARGAVIVPAPLDDGNDGNDDGNDTSGAPGFVAQGAFEQADIFATQDGEVPNQVWGEAPAQASWRTRLRGLPNVSAENTGNIPAQQAAFNIELVNKEELFSEQDSLVNATGAFVPLGTTGVMRPIGEDLLAYHDGEEIYVHDADDAAISGHYSKTGEYSEPELVNIPNSRVKSFLGSVGDRLSGKKKERLSDSPASWLGVDEKFNARKEGSEIGSWDKFSEEDEGWNGGAFGGESTEENVAAMMGLSREMLDKEVWLVALGANESKNAGLADLFANHGTELKSALFINLLGVGIGDLVFTISEGNYRPAQTDHRMQSLITSAAQGMGIPIIPAAFSAFATDGTETLKRGGRAISLMGLVNQVPANWRWSDDDVSRLRKENLEDTAALVIETIKNS